MSPSSQQEWQGVAVKRLPPDATCENFYELFKELDLMFQVGQHTNIVNLIGYSIDASSLLILTDYAKHGNLKDYLRQNAELNEPDKLIGVETLLFYSYQVATGMQYLHSKKVRSIQFNNEPNKSDLIDYC